MKAPDKICISKFDIANAWDTTVVGIALTTPHPQAKEADYVSFIRKDSILEWAKECTDSFNKQMKDLKQTDIAYRVICGGLSTIELLLNKLNSL